MGRITNIIDELQYGSAPTFKTLFGLEHWLSKSKNKDYKGPVIIGNIKFDNVKDALNLKKK